MLSGHIAAILVSTRSARRSRLVLRNAVVASVLIKFRFFVQFHKQSTCSLAHFSDSGVRGGDLALRCWRALAALSSQSSARRAHVAAGAGRRGRDALGDSRNTRLGAGGSAARDGGGLVPRADQGPLSRPLEASIQRRGASARRLWTRVVLAAGRECGGGPGEGLSGQK